MLRLIGVIMLAAGCSLIGYISSISARRSIHTIEQILRVLDLLICELEYRRTPLPQLCTLAAQTTTGAISDFFEKMELELISQTKCSVQACAETVLKNIDDLSGVAEQLIIMFVTSLGRFDVSGQITEIRRVKEYAKTVYEEAVDKLKQTDKSNRTLWTGVGITIAIILV